MDNREWIDSFCMELLGTNRDWQPEWQAVRYRLGDKMYAMVGTDKSGEALVTMKLLPETSETLRREYPEKIVAGYYMNKTHWSSLYLSSDVPDDVARAMLKEAYELVFASLSKRLQAELKQV